MNTREVIIAALRRDPDLVPKVAASLRDKIPVDGRVGTVAQAAEALSPILEDAVRKRPSKLTKLGLRTSHVLAGLVAEDGRSNRRLAGIARGSTVGIVFIDVANFTSFTAQRGDEAAIDALNRIEETIVSAISGSRGELVKSLGDGFLLAFPSASQAVRGAVAIAHAMKKEHQRDPDFDLELCIAVHAGEPLVEQDDLLGHDVNLTARLLDHCKPGGVLVSETAKELAERRLKSVVFARRRLVKIRGLAGKVAVYPIALSQEAPARAG